MKRILGTILFPALIASAAVAQKQDNSATTNTVETETATTNVEQSASTGGLQIAPRTDQERIDFLNKVAQAYLEEKDYKSAVNAYERVLQIDPQNREARTIISTTYIAAKQYAKAETMLKSLVKDYPDDFRSKNNLAWFYATAGDPAYRHGDKAVTLAQEAMVLAPNDHHVWSTLAEAYYVTGQYDKAYRAAKQMAQLAAHYGKNITKEMVDNYNDQIRKCKRAVESEKALNGETTTNDVDTATAPQLKSAPAPAGQQ